jgi:hypothetical protein
MKLRARLGAAFVGMVLSLLIVSAYELAFEADARGTFSLICYDLRLAVLQHKAQKYSVKTWFKRAFASTPTDQSFPKLQVSVIKRT